MAPTNLQRDIRLQLSIKVVFTFVINPANTLVARSLAMSISYENLVTMARLHAVCSIGVGGHCKPKCSNSIHHKRQAMYILIRV